MAEDWRRAIINLNKTAEEALQILDDAGLRLVLVVDDQHGLKGVVSDGDIRRALLRRINFSAVGVADIMQAQPVTAKVGTNRDQLRLLMKQHSILQIPILDDSGRLVGLETYQDMLQTQQRDNWVFLMAGGYGKRLKPLTDVQPKPMLLVGGKPMLETILENFIDAGYHRFYISVYYLADQIKSHFGDGSKWGVTIRYIEEDKPLGTGGALGFLPDISTLPVIMMNGDILTRLDLNALLDFHTDHKAELTMCVREYEMQVPFGVVEGEGFRVDGIIEKPTHSFFVNAGIYVVSPSVVARTRPVRRIDMPELVQEVLADGENVTMFPIHEYWLDIGRPEDFELAQTGGIRD